MGEPLMLFKISPPWLGQLTLAALLALTINSISLRDITKYPLNLGSLTAYAQRLKSDVSDGEVRSYAVSVLQMDAPRSQAFEEIQNLLNQVNFDITQIDWTCPNAQDLDQIPREVRNEVRDVFVGFCNQASDIVQRNDLTIRRFNAISESHQTDPGLAERIRNEMIQLQQN